MNKELFYNDIAEDFDSIMNMYDTNRRIEVIFKDFLGDENLTKQSLLDAGCGTGWFTKKAVERGAEVTTLDIAPKLVDISVNKSPKAKGIVGSLLDLPFDDNSFSYVISSEVIEHTPNPYDATLEMIRVLKPGGKICITAPNRTFWYFSLKLAQTFNLRDYQGYENWVHYHELKSFLINNGIDLIGFKGIHLYPFVVPALNKPLYWLDQKLDQKLGWMMVNVAAFGIKKG
ncbi:class I SAM-dependent methyltransferase [Reichenbachiella versicolor]|uniref:class I SAM-dependent methyltransferase n=1 Tax=Reichenbachiella versicolor TaxID=1821036 RepID=UPI000D6DDCED|nr:class I SAM-dependent methyltransferase [Reichenbachiella versicolor]